MVSVARRKCDGRKAAPKSGDEGEKRIRIMTHSCIDYFGVMTPFARVKALYIRQQEISSR